VTLAYADSVTITASAHPVLRGVANGRPCPWHRTRSPINELIIAIANVASSDTLHGNDREANIEASIEASIEANIARALPVHDTAREAGEATEHSPLIPQYAMLSNI
jgi:hypothetical protein